MQRKRSERRRTRRDNLKLAIAEAIDSQPSGKIWNRGELVTTINYFVSGNYKIALCQLTNLVVIQKGHNVARQHSGGIVSYVFTKKDASNT